MSADAGDRDPGFSPGMLGANDDPFRAIAEAIPGMVWTCTPDGACDYVSHRWVEYTGANRQQILRDGGLSFIHPEDVARVQQAWKRGIETGQSYEVESRLRGADGIYRWHSVRSVPERDAHKGVTRWVGVCIDIEEQKRAQEEATTTQTMLSSAKEELERTVTQRTHQLEEVIEQLEAFAYSIAHDMRAPLRTMHQYAEALTRDFAARVPEEARIYCHKIMAAAERLDSLIREVLIYTRVSQGRLEMQPINLERLLSEILVMYPQLNPPEAELHARLPLQAVIADETALRQALSNLLTNAVKFVPGDRKPDVRIWTEPIGEKVRIYIKDNGIGIAPRDQQRIFKMFERLQPESKYEGSGIGLTIVRRAIERMAGKLGIESEEGAGSVFWIELQKGEL